MPPIYRCYAGRVEKLTLDALDRETAQKKRVGVHQGKKRPAVMDWPVKSNGP